MKVEVVEKEIIKVNYPCLMISTEGEGTIVLFKSKSVGMVLYSESGKHKIGFYFYGWIMDVFKPLQEKLILSND